MRNDLTLTELSFNKKKLEGQLEDFTMKALVEFQKDCRSLIKVNAITLTVQDAKVKASVILDLGDL
jgi:hypothetical protein